MPRIEIVPSILSADAGRLAEQVKEAEAAGADRIQVDVMDGHFVPNLTFGPLEVEATSSLYRTVQTIKELGAQAGVAINPATSVEELREILPYIDLVNVMTVEPGFGGQKFIPHSPDKVRRLRGLSAEIEIEVDGGNDARI